MKSLYKKFNRTISIKDKKSLIKDIEYHRKMKDQVLVQIDDIRRDLNGQMKK